MKKILIIEDDLALQDTLHNLLELEGFRTFKADNGQAGVEIATKHVPDLIICDVMMPVMSGFDVIKYLQKNEKTSLIPFIFLTAKSEIKDFRSGMGLGADDYIMKPFNNEELLKSIHFRINKHQKLIESQETFKSKNVKRRKPATKNISNLTKREKEIVHLFCKGYSCSEISKELYISFHTVDSHRKNIEKKLKVKNIPSIVRYAYENNLVDK